MTWTYDELCDRCGERRGAHQVDGEMCPGSKRFVPSGRFAVEDATSDPATSGASSDSEFVHIGPE